MIPKKKENKVVWLGRRKVLLPLTMIQRDLGTRAVFLDQPPRRLVGLNHAFVTWEILYNCSCHASKRASMRGIFTVTQTPSAQRALAVNFSRCSPSSFTTWRAVVTLNTFPHPPLSTYSIFFDVPSSEYSHNQGEYRPGSRYYLTLPSSASPFFTITITPQTNWIHPDHRSVKNRSANPVLSTARGLFSQCI